MSDRLKDQSCAGSGAGSSGPGWGNGKATAVLFAREGAKVLAADINLDAAHETKRIIEGEGGICEAVSGDVSLAADVATIVDACIAAFGRIDVLHNNVGIVEVGGPVETTEESWDRVNDACFLFKQFGEFRTGRRPCPRRPWNRKNDCRE